MLTTFRVTVDPGETRQYSLRGYDGVAGTVSCPSDFITARAGYIASASSGGGTAEFTLSSELTDKARLDLSNYYGELTWSGFALFNGTDSDVTVTPRYFTTDGLSHTGSAFTLGAMEKRVDYFENELGQPFTNLSMVVFETDSPALTAITISGKDNDKLLFTRSSQHADTWEQAETFTMGHMESSYVYYKGQAVTPNRVFVLLWGYGDDRLFANRLISYDKASGTRESSTDFGSDFESMGIVASTAGDSIYVYGIKLSEFSSEAYRVYRFDPDTGEITAQQELDDGVYATDHEYFPFKRLMHVAATGNTCLVVTHEMGASGIIQRRLFTSTLTSQLNQSTWMNRDLVVTDVTAYNGQYYMLGTDFNATDGVYNKLMFYHFPYNSLMGGGGSWTLQDLRWDGENTHLFAEGMDFDGDDVWFCLKVAIGKPVFDNMDYLMITTADIIPCHVDLTDNSFYRSQVMQRNQTTLNANVVTFRNIYNSRYMWVSNLVKSIVIRIATFKTRVNGKTIIDPVIEGDDLYLVTFILTYDDLNTENSDRHYNIWTIKTTFTDYFLSEQ